MNPYLDLYNYFIHSNDRHALELLVLAENGFSSGAAFLNELSEYLNDSNDVQGLVLLKALVDDIAMYLRAHQ